jgi:ankyrin repeat protein
MWLLLKHKANVNVKDSDGEIALHLAAKNRHEIVVPQLLEHKPDVNAKSSRYERQRYTGQLEIGTRQWCSCY